jgi:hypothetical protein
MRVDEENTFADQMAVSYSDFSNKLTLVKGICLDIFRDSNQEVEFDEYSTSLTIRLQKVTFEQKTHSDLDRLWDLGFKQITLIEKKFSTFRKEFNNAKEE